MSLIGAPFRHDIFVSYSHGPATAAGDRPLRAWSVAFVEALERELNFGMPKWPAAVFIDASDRPGEGISPPLGVAGDELNGELRDSAFLMVLMSPDYLRSQWCAFERDRWFEVQTAPERNVGRGLGRRVLLVRIAKTDGAQWPKELLDKSGKELLGFDLIDEKTERPVGYPVPVVNAQTPFFRAVNQMARWLRAELEEVRRTLEFRRLAEDRDNSRRLREPERQDTSHSHQSVTNTTTGEIFLSYAQEDRRVAESLANFLTSKGWSVWWDRTILPGDEFDQVIEDALAAARCVIVLWSNASRRSSWVRAESADGAKRRILVPALIEQVSVPLEFNRLHTADLVNWDLRSGDHGGIVNLSSAVASVLRRGQGQRAPS